MSAYLSVPAIAKRLGVSRQTVYQYRDKHSLPLGYRGRIERAAFDQWLATFERPKIGRPVKKRSWKWIYR